MSSSDEDTFDQAADVYGSPDSQTFIQAADLVGSPNSQIFFDAYDADLARRLTLSNPDSSNDMTQLQSPSLDNVVDNDTLNNDYDLDNHIDNHIDNNDNKEPSRETDHQDVDNSVNNLDINESEVNIDYDSLTPIPTLTEPSNVVSDSVCQNVANNECDDQGKKGKSVATAGQNDDRITDCNKLNQSNGKSEQPGSSIDMNPTLINDVDSEKETISSSPTNSEQLSQFVDEQDRECSKHNRDDKNLSEMKDALSIQPKVSTDNDNNSCTFESKEEVDKQITEETDIHKVPCEEEIISVTMPLDSELVPPNVHTKADVVPCSMLENFDDDRFETLKNPDDPPTEETENNESFTHTRVPKMNISHEKEDLFPNHHAPKQSSLSGVVPDIDSEVETINNSNVSDKSFSPIDIPADERYCAPQDYRNNVDFHIDIERSLSQGFEYTRSVEPASEYTWPVTQLDEHASELNETESESGEPALDSIEPASDLGNNADLSSVSVQKYSSNAPSDLDVSANHQNEEESYGASQSYDNSSFVSSSRLSLSTSCTVDDAAMQKSPQKSPNNSAPNSYQTLYDKPDINDHGYSHSITYQEQCEVRQSQRVTKRSPHGMTSVLGESVYSNESINNETTPLLPGNQQRIKVYHRRWWILLLFCLTSFMQGLGWGSWGPITQSLKAAFEWTNTSIALLGLVGNGAYVFSSVPVCFFLERFGMRVSMIFSQLLITIGFALRCISADHTIFLWMANVGQFFIGVGAVVPFSAVSLISSLWFPQSQRTTATAVATVFGYLGVASGFVIGPTFVPDPKFNGSNTSHSGPTDTIHSLFGTDKPSGNCTNIDEVKDAVMGLQYYQSGFCALILLMIIIYFPSKPPTPPSVSAHLERLQFVEGMKSLFRNKHFLAVIASYSFGTGVYGVFGIILDIVLNPLGVSQNTAGWMGFWATVSGCLAGIVASLISDVFTRRLKQFIIMMLVPTFGILVWFCLMAAKIVPHTEVSLYITVVAPGLFIYAVCPLFYEYACEASYPTGEGITTLALTVCNNIIGIIFLLVFMIPNIGVDWMNWFLLASVGLCIVILLPVRVRYKRTNIDLEIIVEPPNISTSDGTI